MQKTKKKQSAQENHKGVFNVYKVVMEFQTEKKKKMSVVPNAIQSGQATTEPKVFPGF